ncbi:hypothetical protein ACWGCW_29770 [Streptomyces sp. NPDC054933]
MKDEQRNRLDDRTAEQLLRCGSEAAEVEELRPLSGLLQVVATPPVVDEEPVPTVGEEAAVAAFRSAPVRKLGRRRMAGSLKAGVGAATAALLFGGVAVAAQTGALHLPFSGGQKPSPGGTRVPASAPAQPSTTPAPAGVPDGLGSSSAPPGGRREDGAPSSSAPADPHAASQALRGLCIAYRTQRQAHGTPHSSGGLRRLVQAAGSEAAVADYCAELLGPGGTGDTSDGSTPGSSAAGKTPANSPSRKAR